MSRLEIFLTWLEKFQWHPSPTEKVLLVAGYIFMGAWVIHPSFWLYLGGLFAWWGLHVLDQDRKRREALEKLHHYEPSNVYGDASFVGDDELMGKHLLKERTNI